MHIKFFSLHLDDYTTNARRSIGIALKKLSNEYVAATSQEELVKELLASIELTNIPSLKFDDREMDPPNYSVGSNAAEVVVYVPFAGNGQIFQFRHAHAPLPSPSYDVDAGNIVMPFRIPKVEIHDLDNKIKRDTDLIEQYLVYSRRMIPLYNEQFAQFAKSEVEKRLAEVGTNLKANAELAKLPIKIRKRADDTEKLVIPVQRKQLPVPSNKPTPSTPASREFSIDMAEYDEILKTVTSMAKVMERSPSAFADMNEEPLRTVLLVALNGIYEGQATSETFNGEGKTDILIRREDKNVFIAECLIWKGQKYLLSKMNDQLFKYAVWRDSKLSLIVFNRGGTFSNVINTMKETVKTHPQCLKELAYTHESGARYEFKRHDDPDRQFILTALAFNVPE